MHRENIYNIIKFIILAKVILILLFLGSCTSVDYIILNDNKIDSQSDIGIITFNIKAIYEKEELQIDDLMKLINNGTNDFVVFQELFDESTREKIIERADRNKFSTVIARVDYNSFPEFIFQDAGLFMM
ncbi:MAG: hypothetical protein KDC52_09475, partial [Ignavibacteriae bacterium]|nr:hypothetical protein [Ignavibacteriota bacterium]